MTEERTNVIAGYAKARIVTRLDIDILLLDKAYTRSPEKTVITRVNCQQCAADCEQTYVLAAAVSMSAVSNVDDETTCLQLEKHN